jgi:hypothetical protein
LIPPRIIACGSACAAADGGLIRHSEWDVLPAAVIRRAGAVLREVHSASGRLRRDQRLRIASGSVFDYGQVTYDPGGEPFTYTTGNVWRMEDGKLQGGAGSHL